MTFNRFNLSAGPKLEKVKPAIELNNNVLHLFLLKAFFSLS